MGKIDRERERERETDRQTDRQTDRHNYRRQEIELGARERYIGRRERAQRQGRAWGHRQRRREGRGGVRRGGELTDQCS